MNLTTNEQQELFELCKEVYRRFPEWDEKKDYLFVEDSFHESHPEWDEIEVAHHDMSGKGIPLYTSDYLLDKLPKDMVDDESEVHAITLYCGRWSKQWLAGYEGYFGGQNDPTDTPLKALLKLVIALDDAGVKL